MSHLSLYFSVSTGSSLQPYFDAHIQGYPSRACSRASPPNSSLTSLQMAPARRAYRYEFGINAAFFPFTSFGQKAFPFPRVPPSGPSLSLSKPLYRLPDVGLAQGIPAQAQPNAPVGTDSCFPDTFLKCFVAGEPRTQPLRLRLPLGGELDKLYMCQYIEFVADRLLVAVGCPTTSSSTTAAPLNRLDSARS
jgi:hypothetical protein